MNLLIYRKKIKSKIFLFIIIIISVTSCIEEKDYRTPENFNKLMNRTIKFADDFNNKTTKENFSLLGLNFRINKEKIMKNSNGSYIYYDISIPYNLRDEQLKLFLEEFVDKYMKKRSHIIIDIKHIGIEKISGVVARYEAKLKSNSVRLNVKFLNYVSRESLQKKGIKHYMLKYDYKTLVQISQEMKKNKNLSIKSASINIANHYKLSIQKVNLILKFARQYYKKPQGKQ